MSGNDNSKANAGFDGPRPGGGQGGTSDSSSHGEQQKTDWPKKVGKMYEEYLASCPGSHETIGNFGSTSPSESWNPLMSVSCFAVNNRHDYSLLSLVMMMMTVRINIYLAWNSIWNSFKWVLQNLRGELIMKLLE